MPVRGYELLFDGNLALTKHESNAQAWIARGGQSEPLVRQADALAALAEKDAEIRKLRRAVDHRVPMDQVSSLRWRVRELEEMVRADRLTMQEARQHIGEQVPRFAAVLGNALDLSPVPLRDAIAAGKVTKNQAIAALARRALDLEAQLADAALDRRIAEIVREWRKGCSVAPKGQPWQCDDCTAGMLEAIDSVSAEAAADKLCTYCGRAGHRAHACPLRERGECRQICERFGEPMNFGRAPSDVAGGAAGGSIRADDYPAGGVHVRSEGGDSGASAR